ncbi:TonB-dependent receptor plug domain-containing protein [Parasphingorhabdus sp. DH2-15]|uniref:TonB-dependent receptor plug domain-containing protein n=1 Tax=Parasphingorhabdus sp. DH2-15 TaxID=3444112 RepID=UPI003F6864B7
MSSAVGTCLWSVSAAAQDISANNDDQFEADNRIVIADRVHDEFITVLGSALSDRTSNSNRALTIIGADEIDQIQTPDITQILERAPGVTTTRNGPIGGFTSVRVRGSTSDQVLVLIDGIRLNDPSAPGAGFDFANVQTGNITKVEILRGANSIIWGSNAIGGVIALDTRGSRGTASLTGEGGSFGTVNLSGSVRPDIADGLDVNISGGYFDNDGFSSFADGTENDGFRQSYINGHAGYSLTSGIYLFAQGRFATSRLDIDGFPAPAFAFADTDEFQETQQFSASAGVEYSGDNLELRALYSIADIDRDNFNPAFGDDVSFFAEGRNERIELRGELQPVNNVTVFFGLENEETRFETGPFGTAAESGIDSAYGLLRYNDDVVNISAGLRVDDHEQFGSQVTFGADASIALDVGWKLVGAYQEGFRAPSLFQLLSDFGNTNLQPETSQSFEVGIQYNDRNSVYPIGGSVTLFTRDTDNQIDFISCFGVTDAICDNRPFGTFDNILSTRAQGVEADLSVQPIDTFIARIAYSYIDTENRSAGSANVGNVLARQPDNVLTLSADWTPELAGKPVNLGGDVRLVSDSFDNAANSVRLDGFAVVRLRASYDITDNIQLYGRVENLFDAQYQTVSGFGTPGMSAFGGVRVTL